MKNIHIILSCISLFLLISCNQEKRLQRKYISYRNNHKTEFANDCANAFPSVPEIKLGQDITTEHDSIAYIHDTINGNSIHDTIVKYRIRYTQKTDTYTTPDLAKEKALRDFGNYQKSMVDSLFNEYNKKQISLSESKQKSSSLFIAVIILSVSLAVLLVLMFKK